MKALFVAILMCSAATMTFGQNIDQRKPQKAREVAISEKTTIEELIGLKQDYELADYSVVMVNKGSDHVYIWRKGTFPEDQIIDLIQENRSETSVVYIEKINYRIPGSDELKSMEPVKIKLL